MILEHFPSNLKIGDLICIENHQVIDEFIDNKEFLICINIEESFPSSHFIVTCYSMKERQSKSFIEGQNLFFSSIQKL